MLVFWKAKTGFPGGAQDRVDGAGGRIPALGRCVVSEPATAQAHDRAPLSPTAGPGVRTGRPADGADGDHARAGGLAVELVSLPQPSGAGGSSAIDGRHGFRHVSSRPGCRRTRRSLPRSAVSRASCRRRMARSGSTHLFRYDRMAAALAFLEDRLGAAPQLERLNTSPAAPATELSDPMLKRLRREAARNLPYGIRFAPGPGPDAAPSVQLPRDGRGQVGQAEGFGQKHRVRDISRHLSDIVFRVARDEDDFHAGMIL
jgi:hypothetical protein